MTNNTNIPAGYKNSPVGIIPNEWEVKRLEDLCETISSGKNKKKLDTGTYPIFGSTGIIGNSDEYVYDFPMILIARVGANAGQVNKVQGRYDVSDNTLIVNPKKEYHFNFAYNQLKHFRINKLIFGSGQPLVTASQLKVLFFPLPPLPEQKRIAEVLSTWDAAIENLSQTLTLARQRKKALMQQLLTGKKRLKGFEGEWKEYHLRDFFTERNETHRENLQLLSIGQNGVYPQTDSNKRDISNDDKSKYKRICPNDIGYNTMRMWQGRSALSEMEGIVSPAYTILQPKSNTDSFFFAYLFKTSKMINFFWRNSQGLVEDTLNCKYKDFSIIKIHLPEKTEQTAISRVLLAADKETALLEAKLLRLREQKKGLMQVLLTGKKRLKPTCGGQV